MKRYSSLVVLGAVLLCMVVLGADAVGAGSVPTPNKFVGTALNEITFSDGQNDFTFASIGTLHADGTINASDAEDFFPGPISAIDGVARGTWKMVGPRTLEGVTIYHAFDENGVLAFTGRNDFQLNLVDGQAYDAAGSGVGRIYFPGQDPLDLDAGTIVGTFQMTSRRVEP